MIRKMVDSAGGRRFVLCVGAGLATTVLQWAGKLDPAGSTYALVVVGTISVYVTGNTAQKIKGEPK